MALPAPFSGLHCEKADDARYFPFVPGLIARMLAAAERTMRERPVSVMIFGILNIGFGLLGMAEAVLSKLFEGFGSSAASSTVNSVVAFLATLQNDPVYVVWNQITQPLNFAVGAVLLAAGVGLLLLKNWARLTSISYGIYKIVFVVLNGAVLFLALHHILAKSVESGFAVGILVVAGLVGAILTLIYPALLIFFMTRPKVVLAFQPEPPPPS